MKLGDRAIILEQGHGEGDLAATVADGRPRLTLRANMAWVLVGNVVYSGCQWAMLIALAKLGSTAMVGDFSLALAITAPIILFTNMQLRGVQATDATQEYSFSDYLSVRVLTTLLALLTILAITLALGYSVERSAIILTVGLAKAFEAISDIYYGLLQHRERMDRLALSMIIKGILSLATFTLAVYLTHSVLWGVLALALSWALVLVGFDLHSGAGVLSGSSGNLAKFRLQWRRAPITRLIKLSLPLGFVMMLVSLNSNLPRYFIEHFRGAADLGVYSAIAYLTVAGTTLATSIGTAATSRLSQYHAIGNRQAYTALLLKLCALALLLGGGGLIMALVTGPEILTLFYKAEYAAAADVLVWIAIGSGIGYIATFLGMSTTAARYFRIQLPLWCAITLVTAVSCLLLVPDAGLLGAAIATLCGTLVALAGGVTVMIHIIRHMAVERNADSG